MDLVLTLQWILQVLLTKKYVKIDCLVHAYPFLVVNNDWTGNGGVWFSFEGRVEIKGSFWAVNVC